MSKQRKDFDCRQQFFRWLKDQGLYTRFCHNVNAAGNMYRLRDLSDFCTAVHYVNWFFNWDKTPEGYGFWNYIDDQWMYFLKNLNKKN